MVKVTSSSVGEASKRLLFTGICMFSDVDNKLHFEKPVKLTQKTEKHQWPVVPPALKVKHNLMTGQVKPDLVLEVVHHSIFQKR